jgi:phosphomannomutase
MKNILSDIPVSKDLDIGDLLSIGKTLKTIVTVVETFRANKSNAEMHAAAKAALTNLLNLKGELEDKPIAADVRATFDGLADRLIVLAVKEYNLVREQVIVAKEIQAVYAEVEALGILKVA